MFNPLNAELNLICHLLALLEARHILHVSRIRVKCVPLFCSCNICVVLWEGPKECVFVCVCSMRCFGEVERVVGCPECVLVFLEPSGKASTGLPYIRFSTVGAC